MGCVIATTVTAAISSSEMPSAPSKHNASVTVSNSSTLALACS